MLGVYRKYLNYRNHFTKYLRIVFSFLLACAWQTSWQMLLTCLAALEDTAPAAVSKIRQEIIFKPTSLYFAP